MRDSPQAAKIPYRVGSGAILAATTAATMAALWSYLPYADAFGMIQHETLIGVTLSLLIVVLALATRLVVLEVWRHRNAHPGSERSGSLATTPRSIGGAPEPFRAFLEAGPVALLLVSADGRIRLANPAAHRLLGVPAALLEGMDVRDLLPNDRDVMERALATGLSDCDSELVAVNGTRAWASVSTLRLDADGQSHLLFSLFDLTARKIAQDEITDALTRAKAAAAAKSRFIAAVNHHLRQPVQNLFFLTGTLGRQVSGGAARETLRHIDEALECLSERLDNWADISKIEAGRCTASIETFPINSLLDEITAEYAPRATGKGLTFHVAPTDAAAVSDRHLLGRIVRSLVENALRFTQEGNVAIDCRVIGSTMSIAVQDTGAGISQDRIRAIFAEYPQASIQEGEQKPTCGLGLAVAQRLARLLGHTIAVTSNLGHGSTFTVTLPLGTTLAPENAGASEAEHEHCQMVAVVEDDRLVRSALQSMLESWGYEVIAAASGSELLAALSAHRCVPVAMLADYRLVDETGVQVIQEVRRLYGAPIPAMVITGETSEDCQKDASAHGILLKRKPVAPKSLRPLLASLIAGGQAPRSATAA